MNCRKSFVFVICIIIILFGTGGCFFQSKVDKVPDEMYGAFNKLNFQGYFEFYEKNFAISADRDFSLPEYYQLGDRQYLKRPVMVSVENHPRSRPQAGLDSADLVYEVLAEGGITRFLPVFHNKLPEKVGPIRSARDYIGDLTAQHGALLLHAGASPGGYARLSAEDVLNLDEIEKSQYYWRSSDRKMPHNLYTDNDRISDYVNDLNWQKDRSAYKFDFSSGNNPGNQKENDFISKINLFYWGNYQVTYRYDQSKDRYYRFINNEPHKVENGAQLFADNIIIIYADTNVIDDVGRISIDLESGGQACLINNGRKKELAWEKNNGKITLLDDDNQEAIIYSGKTWIQIMPKSARVEFD